jgi:hypothetical protein
MALTGKLLGNFDSFVDACEKARTNLVKFEDGANKVQSALDRMVKDFSGKKIIQDASLMAEAFERLNKEGIGLTNEELARMGAVANEAVAKLKALGLDVPPGIAKIATETKTATSSMESMKRIAVDLAGAFGIAFSIGAIVNFGKEIFALADNIVKLSDKTGLTVEEVQRLSYVAEQSGNSVEQLTDSVSKLQVHLSDPKAQEAVRDLGVNFQQLKAASPYQQLQLIADAMSKVVDPAKQAEYAVALFGKTGAEILPTLKSHFSDLAKEVTVASDQEVRAMDAAGDAMHRLSSTVKAETVNIIGSFILAGEQAQNIGLLKVLAAFVANGAPQTIAALAAVGGAAHAAGKDINLPIDKDPLEEYRKHLDETRESVSHLSDAQKQAITDGLKLGDSQSDIASALNLSTQAIAAFVEAEKEATDNRIFVEKLAQEWHNLYVDMRLTGIKNINEYAKAVQEAMAKQREAVQASQLQLLGLITAQRTELANLNGTALTGVDAAMAALDKKYAADIAHIEQLGRAATEAGVGGPAWAQQAQEAADNAYRIYVEQFNRIVAASDKTFGTDVPAALDSAEIKSAAGQGASGISGPFTLAFQSVEGPRMRWPRMWPRCSARSSKRTPIGRRDSSSIRDSGRPTRSITTRSTRSGTLPSFASGVQNFAGGMALVGERGPELVNLPKGSSVTPNGGVGGVTVTIGTIVASSAQEGRAAADALTARLKTKGVRI